MRHSLDGLQNAAVGAFFKNAGTRTESKYTIGSRS